MRHLAILFFDNQKFVEYFNFGWENKNIKFRIVYLSHKTWWDK